MEVVTWRSWSTDLKQTEKILWSCRWWWRWCFPLVQSQHSYCPGAYACVCAWTTSTTCLAFRYNLVLVCWILDASGEPSSSQSQSSSLSIYKRMSTGFERKKWARRRRTSRICFLQPLHPFQHSNNLDNFDFNQTSQPPGHRHGFINHHFRFRQRTIEQRTCTRNGC